MVESFEQKETREKPKGLKATSVMLCVFALAGIPSVEGVLQGRIVSVATALTVTALWLFVIWRYWLGRAWARWVVMVGTVLSFIGLFYFPPRWYDRIYLISESAFGMFLLYWLNTKTLRTYFADAQDLKTKTTEMGPEHS